VALLARWLGMRRVAHLDWKKWWMSPAPTGGWSKKVLQQLPMGLAEWWLWAVVALLVFTSAIIGWRLGRIPQQDSTEQPGEPRKRTENLLKNARGPLDDFRGSKWVRLLEGNGSSWAAVIATIAAACFLAIAPPERVSFAVLFWTLFFFFGFQQLRGGFRCVRDHHKGQSTWSRVGAMIFWVLIPVVCAAVALGLIWLARYGPLLQRSDSQLTWRSFLPITIGPALIVLSLMAGGWLQIGLMGMDFPDAEREWLTQFGSRLWIVTMMWTAVFAISIYGALWVSKLGLWKLPALVAWTSSGWLSWVAGWSSKTSGTKTPESGRISPTLETVANVAPPIFMVLTLLVTSFLAHVAVWQVMGAPKQHGCPEQPSGFHDTLTVNDGQVELHSQPIGGSEWPKWAEPVRCWLSGMEKEYWCILDSDGLAWTFALGAAGLVLVFFLFSPRFNINEFSLHHFYKNRLVRCYMGAGRAKDRKPDKLTGFDPKDDFKISSLRPSKGYYGPYPILNCTLNVNQGTELATAERKALRFVFSPLFCGFEPRLSRQDGEWVGRKEGRSQDGYRKTEHFMTPPEGPNLGTAMAISGAALNPNSGYHTSTAMAFLLTAFNVRLGWWVGNPRRAKESRHPGPRIALFSLLEELFGSTDSRTGYVNLSDGGHFENLGLYELVRRRCRYIIVGDAEEDRTYSFEALGRAIRMCRDDLGVEIDLDTKLLKPSKEKPFSERHCVVGTIRYPERPAPDEAIQMCVPEAEKADEDHLQGWLVYFKASLTGDEPEDIQEHSREHTAFPHEPTANQFFGEAQFESYRKLGEHVVATIFERIKPLTSPTANDRLLELFQDLYASGIRRPRRSPTPSRNAIRS
jgi:hypothetical protein